MSLDYLAHVRADSARFAEVLAGVDPGVRVPTCPDWTAADLLWHLGEVQHFWGTIVRDRLTDGNAYRPPLNEIRRTGDTSAFEMVIRQGVH